MLWCESVVPVLGSISQAEMRPAVSSHHSLHPTERSSLHNLQQAVQSVTVRYRKRLSMSISTLNKYKT